VAVIGGGCASMTAAFELTRPEHRGRYDVTIYQPGWRIGGKGASGRGPAGRIEEHGLHLWMGFYENAFRLMRAVYEEAGRDPLACRIADWRQAFAPAPEVAVSDRAPGGSWEHWVAHFPACPGLPGDPLATENPFTVAGYLQRAVLLLLELLRSAPPRTEAAPDQILEAIDRLLKFGQLAGAAALSEAGALLHLALGALGWPAARAFEGPLLRLVDLVAGAARRQLDLLVVEDAEVRRVWSVVGLRSRWTTPAACAHESASSTWSMRCRASIASSGPSSRSTVARSRPGTYSNTV
jgi:uncharacterized protein with NAD-binding domain and iron-sulfur cluster